MAITAAQMQTALGDTINAPRVMRHYGVNGTLQEWLIQGGVTYPGRTKFVATTASDNATTQAAAVVTALLLPNAGNT